MRYKSRSSSLSGCQLDIRQLSDAWEMVLRGVNNQKREVSLTHRKRDATSENGLEYERITTRDLKSIIDEAGEPARLSNLTLTASQKAPSRTTSQKVPSREVTIEIGPGKHTKIFVEAEAADYTWMSTTHKELLKIFRESQKWYAPSGWWKVGRRLTSLADSLPLLVDLVLLSTLLVLAFFVAAYYYFIVIQVPYELISILVHNERWTTSDAFYSLTSLAVITVTTYAISFMRTHDESIVITKPPTPLLSPNRLKILKTIAAIVAFIAGIITIIAEMKTLVKLLIRSCLTR